MIRFSLIRSHLSLKVLPTTDSTRAGVTPLSALSALLSLVARSFVHTTLGQKTFSKLPSVIASVQQALKQGRQLYFSIYVVKRGGERTKHIHILAFGYSFSLSDLPSIFHMKMQSSQSLIASDLHYKFSERCRRSTSASHQSGEAYPHQPLLRMSQGGAYRNTIHSHHLQITPLPSPAASLSSVHMVSSRCSISTRYRLSSH
jgi:hypothetical protein